MKIKFVLFALPLLLSCVNAFSQKQSRYKPLNYLFYKRSMHALFQCFDSLTTTCSLSIVKGMQKNTVHIYYRSGNTTGDKYVAIEDAALKACANDLHIDADKLSKVICLLNKTKAHSIKNGDQNTIELCTGFGLQHLLSDNGKGLIYFPGNYRRALMQTNDAKIKHSISYSSSMSSY